MLFATKRNRRTPVVLCLILCCAVALTILLVTTSRLVHRTHAVIRKRGETEQELLRGDFLDKIDNTTVTVSDDNQEEKSRRGKKSWRGKQDPQGSSEESTNGQDDLHPTWLLPPNTTAFPSFEGYAETLEKARELPDIIYIAFEDAVKDDALAGWEAEWVANGTYDIQKWGLLKEPRIDFVYTWVNGSEAAFGNTKHPYELNSTLNDKEGVWLAKHGENRYRDWNELKYSVRSIEAYAPFRNKVQVLVNSLETSEGTKSQKQIPTWLDPKSTGEIFEVLPQEDFFSPEKRACLPTFNSLTIESQIYNTESGVDQLFALSDDMLLGRPHAASDIYSPLFGPLLAFKTNAYNTQHRPTEADAKRFGEKPWLIYTSWLLNRRFGARKRKGQAHLGHSLSRKVLREAQMSFPGPELMSACSRFRGDFGLQFYPWYGTFHYIIERHREVLLWSYLVHRSDINQDGYLSWHERQQVLEDLEEGLKNEGKSSYRERNFYHLPDTLQESGLQPPKVNLDILWTSMDGPITAKDSDCFMFDVNDCLAPGFSFDSAMQQEIPVFSTSTIFDRVARQQPECGDCLIKILLHRTRRGLSPLMPNPELQPTEYEVVVKALMRYQYVVHEPDGLFVMVTDAEQVETTLINRLLIKKKQVGQLCLNDDVSTHDPLELQSLRKTISALFEGLFPKPSRFERGS